MSADPIKKKLKNLPFATADLPGVGGKLKTEPDFFEVTEVLAYEASGEGEHVYVTVQRREWNTPDVAKVLADAVGAGTHEVGWAGMKDRNALTTQTFSIRADLSRDLAVLESKLHETPFTILEVKRHLNKIKPGHAKANRFRIILTDLPEPSSALAQARMIAQALMAGGLPNYYGEQRFGHELNNIDQVYRLLEGRPRKNRRTMFLASALQSALFNIWLAERLSDGTFSTLIAGDLAQKTDTGGLFVVEDLEEAEERFLRHELTYTGPMFGKKMRTPKDAAFEREIRVLQEANLALDDFSRLRSAGTRRQGLLWLGELEIKQDEAGLCFEFALPSGAYATSVLREFSK